MPYRFPELIRIQFFEPGFVVYPEQITARTLGMVGSYSPYSSMILCTLFLAACVNIKNKKTLKGAIKTA